LILAASKGFGDPVRGTGVMLSKAVCVALFVTIPAFLGYPALLNLDRRVRSSPSAESIDVEFWPVPAASVSLQPRWLVIDAPANKLLFQDGGVLTKELQRQLRRVGCYSGEINGAWTQSTRRAMQTFTNRVNAALPVERPDHVLLAMLQGHPDKTCSKPCPLGENPSPDGRCMPGAMTGLPIKTAALSHPKPRPLVTSWRAAETTALEDAIPTIPAREPVMTPPAKAQPIPRMMIAAPPPANLVSPRPAVTATNREQPRVSHRPEREHSRPIQQSEFVRTLFQRLDNSAR
jgi:peptidoglycan hydrolase-like protein with peptidoglycan-binding domain